MAPQSERTSWGEEPRDEEPWPESSQGRPEALVDRVFPISIWNQSGRFPLRLCLAGWLCSASDAG